MAIDGGSLSRKPDIGGFLCLRPNWIDLTQNSNISSPSFHCMAPSSTFVVVLHICVEISTKSGGELNRSTEISIRTGEISIKSLELHDNDDTYRKRNDFVWPNQRNYKAYGIQFQQNWQLVAGIELQHPMLSSWVVALVGLPKIWSDSDPWTPPIVFLSTQYNKIWLCMWKPNKTCLAKSLQA